MITRKRTSNTKATSAGCSVDGGLWPSSKPHTIDDAPERLIYCGWRRGISIDVLARQHRLPSPDVEKMINKIRADGIRAQRIEFVHSQSFEAPDAAATILGPMPERSNAETRFAPTAGVPLYLANLYAHTTLLDRQQESHLFRKMNYLKFRAVQMRDALDPPRPRTSDLDEIERLQNEALAVKNEIVRANLRLVVSIAKKYVTPTNTLVELVSEGNMSLMQAVEKFDFARGFKFSTYASSAIIKNFAHAIPKEQKWRNRFVTGREEVFAAAADYRSGEHQDEIDEVGNRQAVERVLRCLDRRERQILVRRFGLGGVAAVTLEQLGRDLGISKERVRQIESRAREKIRQFTKIAEDSWGRC
jgi:RNA polymerase primary sigma factor